MKKTLFFSHISLHPVEHRLFYGAYKGNTKWNGHFLILFWQLENKYICIDVRVRVNVTGFKFRGNKYLRET